MGSGFESQAVYEQGSAAARLRGFSFSGTTSDATKCGSRCDWPPEASQPLSALGHAFWMPRMRLGRIRAGFHPSLDLIDLSLGVIRAIAIR